MKTWITPCNINNYNVIEAFSKLNRLNWKQSTNIEVGDIVYIYVSTPFSRVTHQCKVIEANLKNVYIDDRDYIVDGKPYLNHGRYMTLELIKMISNVDFKWLKNKGLKGNIQGPRTIDFMI